MYTQLQEGLGNAWNVYEWEVMIVQTASNTHRCFKHTCMGSCDSFYVNHVWGEYTILRYFIMLYMHALIDNSRISYNDI